jgi:Mg-chelatase subunit ChlD
MKRSAALLLSFSLAGHAQEGGSARSSTGVHLQFADKIRLVTCDPASKTPCFRLKVNLVDGNGAPVDATLPAPEKLAQSIAVTADNQQVTPFYASASSGRGKSRLRQRIAMILIDTSGSMNQRLSSGQTRFAAARAAAETFGEGFAEGSDQIAIAPFASRNVVPTIRSTPFARTIQELRGEIEALPEPQPRNNTALYSAVDAAISVLKDQARAAGNDAELLLLTMTDGENDVRAGDDPGLLEGAAGLDTIGRRVKDSGIQAIGVGFGDRTSLDEAALRQISTQTYLVNEPAELKRVFSFARAQLNDRLEITFSSPWKDRAALAGRTIPMSVTLRMPDGRELAGGQSSWQAPDIGTPVYEARCSAEESRAVLVTAEAAESSGWFAVLRPAIVFAGFSLVFFILWFWAPRLIWPDRYLGDLQSIYYRRRWLGAGRPSRKGRPHGSDTRREERNWGHPQPPLPAGFSGKHGPVIRDRSPGEATYVQPRPDTGTRTRVDFDWTDRQ